MSTQILKQYESLKAHVHSSKQEQDQRTFSALRRLVQHSLNSPLWRDRLKTYLADVQGSESLPQLLHSLPILTRSEFQKFAPWNQIWIPGSSPGDYGTVRTSGSTGKPVTVVKFLPIYSPETLAVELLDFQWQKIDTSSAMLKYTAAKAESPNPGRIGEPHSLLNPNTGPFHFRQLEETPLRDVVDLILEANIKSALMSPRTIRHMISQVAERSLSDVPLEAIISFADRVDQPLRELALKYLGARIVDRYTASEFSFLAIQCPNAEHLHALQFSNYVEILDQNNRPTKTGEPGRVVVTALSNFSTPLIRYELGDIASWAEPCSDYPALPVLMPQIVRERESYIDDQGRARPILPDYASFANNPVVLDFQILIFTDRQVLVLATSETIESQTLESYRSELSSVTGFDRPGEVFVAESVPWISGWKRKTVVFVDQAFPEGTSLADLSRYLP
jgi:phenylacetate-CoA ligase